jgi:hypothetical protein
MFMHRPPFIERNRTVGSEISNPKVTGKMLAEVRRLRAERLRLEPITPRGHAQTAKLATIKRRLDELAAETGETRKSLEGLAINYSPTYEDLGHKRPSDLPAPEPEPLVASDADDQVWEENTNRIGDDPEAKRYLGRQSQKPRKIGGG